jgi:glycosyltransferase involved in cell wall biosynthesis
MDERATGLRLSVVMPVFNESGTIRHAVQRVRAVPVDIELVVVDDGSTDGCREILAELRDDGLIDQLVLQDRNRGKGNAVRSGIERLTGDLFVVQDADLEYDPQELPRLMAPIASGDADAVFGSRFTGSPRRVLYFWHRVGNGLLTLLSNIFTNVNLSDMETCYKMVRVDLLRTLPLRTDRFGIEPELTARLAQAGARMYEVPISYHGRTYAEGKKIGWRDGVAALWHIVRANLGGTRAPRFEHTLSLVPSSGPTRAAANRAPALAARSGPESDRGQGTHNVAKMRVG